jgi:hypothetical protein
VYAIKDVDDILDYITGGIVSAVTQSLLRIVGVKKDPNLYLTRETLEAMRKCDLATSKRYRDLWNEV